MRYLDVNRVTQDARLEDFLRFLARRIAEAPAGVGDSFKDRLDAYIQDYAVIALRNEDADVRV